MHPMHNRLNRLLALNRAAPREYRIEASEDASSIYLYDVIGYDWWTGGGVTAKQFARDLQQITSSTIHLHVNSPGGDVFEGRAMVAALQSVQAKVIAHIDGLAASAASFLVMHASEIEMTDGAFMMIHNGWTMALGDRHAMLETAARLQKIDASIVDDYLKRAKADRETLAAWMDAETWFTAAEAVDNGLADRIAAVDGKAKALAWNLAAYEHAPSALAEPDHDLDHAHRMRRLEIVEASLA
jgi:ATP-dependent Clp protease protease subunit